MTDDDLVQSIGALNEMCSQQEDTATLDERAGGGEGLGIRNIVYHYFHKFCILN